MKEELLTPHSINDLRQVLAIQGTSPNEKKEMAIKIMKAIAKDADFRITIFRTIFRHTIALESTIVNSIALRASFAFQSKVLTEDEGEYVTINNIAKTAISELKQSNDCKALFEIFPYFSADPKESSWVKKWCVQLFFAQKKLPFSS